MINILTCIEVVSPPLLLRMWLGVILLTGFITDTVLKRLESLNIHFSNDKIQSQSQSNQLFPKPAKTSIAALLNDENKNVDSEEAQWKEDGTNTDIYEDIKQFISSKPQLSSWLSCPTLPFSKSVPKLDVCGVSAKFDASNVAPKLRSSFERPIKQKSRVRKEWTEAEDRAFLAGLSQYKLDFEKIAQMIPGRNKAQVSTGILTLIILNFESVWNLEI